MHTTDGWIKDNYLWCTGFTHDLLDHISQLSGLAEIRDISFRRDTEEIIVVFKSSEEASTLFTSGYLGAMPLSRYRASHDLLIAR